MIIGEKAKKYGLQKPSIFKDDEDSQDVNAMLREANQKKTAKQHQQEQSKVLAEDPTAYDYDSVYDALHQSKQAAAPATKDNRPRYMAALMEKAAIRKVELGIAHDRKAQKERKEEGEVYAGKEKFLTSAYKKKLIDDKAFLEEEARKAALEEDVTKKGDLTSFYTSLLTKNEAYGGGRRPSPPPLVTKEESKANGQQGDDKKDKHRENKEGDSHRDRDREKDRDKEGGRDRDNEKVRDRDREGRDKNNRENRDHRRDDRHRSTSPERERDGRDRDNRRDNRRRSPSPRERGREGRDRDNRRTDKPDDKQNKADTQPLNKEDNAPDSKRPLEGDANSNVPKKIPRANDEASIQAARERYLKRKGLM